MNATGAVVFLPREGNGPSLMLEELLFDPAALWLAESLRAAGVERFFVVCHTDDQARAAACFPAGTEFVTGGSGDAVEQLSAFLNALETASTAAASGSRAPIPSAPAGTAAWRLRWWPGSTVCAACWKPESALWTPAIAMWVPG